MTFNQLATEIQKLTIRERKQLVGLIVDTLAENESPVDDNRSDLEAMSSILELDGLGAELWAGIDAQEYVNQRRDEWDHRL